MIKLNLQRLAKKRGIVKLQAYLKKHGFDKDLASDLNRGEVDYLKFDKMEKLCALFICEPYDFLEWHPDEGVDITTHPLRVMLPKPDDVELDNIVKKLPLDKLDKLIEVAKKLKEGEM